MIQSAQPELLELAKAMRPDWDDELGPALVAAHNAGWNWNRTLLAVARLLVDEKARPRDLAAATRDPLERHPASAELTREGAARARAALTDALGET